MYLKLQLALVPCHVLLFVSQSVYLFGPLWTFVCLFVCFYFASKVCFWVHISLKHDRMMDPADVDVLSGELKDKFVWCCKISTWILGSTNIKTLWVGASATKRRINKHPQFLQSPTSSDSFPNNCKAER